MPSYVSIKHLKEDKKRYRPGKPYEGPNGKALEKKGHVCEVGSKKHKELEKKGWQKLSPAQELHFRKPEGAFKKGK